MSTAVTTMVVHRNVALLTEGAKIVSTSSFENKPVYNFGDAPEAWSCSSTDAFANLLQIHADSQPSCRADLVQSDNNSSNQNDLRAQSRYAYLFKDSDSDRTIDVDLGAVRLLNEVGVQVQLEAAANLRNRSKYDHCAFDVVFRYKRRAVSNKGKEDWIRFGNSQILWDHTRQSQRVKVVSSFPQLHRRPGHAGISTRMVQFVMPKSRECNVSLSPLRLFVYGREPWLRAVQDVDDAKFGVEMIGLAAGTILCILFLAGIAAFIVSCIMGKRRTLKLGDRRATFSTLGNKAESGSIPDADQEDFGHGANSSDEDALGEDDVTDDIEVVSMHSIRDEMERRESKTSLTATPATEGRGEGSSSDEELSPFRDRN